MKLFLMAIALVLSLYCGALEVVQDLDRGGRPISAEVMARTREIEVLRERAAALVKAGRPLEALPLLEEAGQKEDAPPLAFGSGGKYDLAKLLTTLGRENEALAVYRRAFRWNPAKGDIEHNGPPALQISMDYALLLSRNGKVEEVKALYYWGLRMISGWKSRDVEPVPFLIVFDQESEGVFWDYSPIKFEAAALMLKSVNGASREEQKRSILRVRELAPDWFFPDIWLGAPIWNESRGMELLARAETLAKPGIEKQLMVQFRSELEEHKADLDARCLAPAADTRPMNEGARRRSRMACLVPNREILRRVSIG